MWIIINKILDLVFPEKCFGCGQKNTLLCPGCIKRLPRVQTERRLFAATSYESPVIQKIIWALKYKRAKRAARPLAQLLHHHLPLNVRSSTSNIVPVPLSRRRLRKRGFNQAELIARHLSDMLSMTVLTNVLYKNRETTSQVKIKDREKRLKNLKGSFTVKNPQLIQDKTVYLLDDVLTTGATIREARKVLLRAGAKEVIGIVVAR